MAKRQIGFIKLQITAGQAQPPPPPGPAPGRDGADNLEVFIGRRGGGGRGGKLGGGGFF